MLGRVRGIRRFRYDSYGSRQGRHFLTEASTQKDGKSESIFSEILPARCDVWAREIAT